MCSIFLDISLFLVNFPCLIDGDLAPNKKFSRSRLEVLYSCQIAQSGGSHIKILVSDLLTFQVFHCFGQYFCLHFEAFQLGMAPVYMAFLRFMGDENEARNYTYSLEVGGNGRKLTWEGTPRSVRDSHRKVRDSHDGLIIQRNMALFFSGGDRKELKLRVTGRIWKEQQNPDATPSIPNICS